MHIKVCLLEKKKTAHTLDTFRTVLLTVTEMKAEGGKSQFMGIKLLYGIARYFFLLFLLFAFEFRCILL